MEKERLLKTIPLNQANHTVDVINAFSEYNIPIYKIESLNGSYRIDGIINEKSVNIRR